MFELCKIVLGFNVNTVRFFEGVLFMWISLWQAREPKALMKIQTINATFQPTKIGHPYGLQITYLKDNSTRNIFVYHEDGKVKTHLW